MNMFALAPTLSLKKLPLSVILSSLWLMAYGFMKFNYSGPVSQPILKVWTIYKIPSVKAKSTTASLGLEPPRGNTESFYKATTYE